MGACAPDMQWNCAVKPKTYRAAEVETTARHNVNVDIHEGEFVAVMGPSGCGKSTLPNVIGMLDSPTSGAYVFKQQDVSGLREARLTALRKRHLGFVFQSFNLIDELTVEGNVELALLYPAGLEFAAARRTQEIGVRKVLGASVFDIVKLFVWQFSRPVIAANLIAWPVAFYLMHRWLVGFRYAIKLTDPPVFLGIFGR